MDRVIGQLKELGAEPQNPVAVQLQIVHLKRTTDQLGFPVLSFTIANRTSRSQVLNRLECEIIWSPPLRFHTQDQGSNAN